MKTLLPLHSSRFRGESPAFSLGVRVRRSDGADDASGRTTKARAKRPTSANRGKRNIVGDASSHGQKYSREVEI